MSNCLNILLSLQNASTKNKNLPLLGLDHKGVNYWHKSWDIWDFMLYMQRKFFVTILNVDNYAKLSFSPDLFWFNVILSLFCMSFCHNCTIRIRTAKCQEFYIHWPLGNWNSHNLSYFHKFWKTIRTTRIACTSKSFETI